MLGRAPLTLIAAAALTLVGARAHAYCRASTCDPQGAQCEPPQEGDCGKALRWKRGCVGIAVQESASGQVTYPEAKGVLRAAFDAWESADCGGAPPGIRVELLNKVSCAAVEYNNDGGNVNVLVFRDKLWPHKSGPHNVALTTVTFDTKTGEIYDADIEVNTFQYELTVTASTSQYDLLSILTHEAGHFLGMAHAPDKESTMFATYDPGTTDFRSLEADDQAGICAIYPPDEDSTAKCNPIPRHGYSPECADKQTEGTCSAAPGAANPPCGILILAAAGALGAMRRRRATGSRWDRRTRAPRGSSSSSSASRAPRT